MRKQKARIEHAEIVRLFASRLRELRTSRGFTQAQLAREAKTTTNYVGRLEAGSSAPGIDLVARLASALGTTIADLVPASAEAQPMTVLHERAQSLFAGLLKAADRDMLTMLNPLLARLYETASRR